MSREGESGGSMNHQDQVYEGILPTVLDSVAAIFELCSFGDEALTAFLPATLDKVTSSFRGHTSAEAMLVLTRAFGRLIRAFHIWRLSLKRFAGLGNVQLPMRRAGQ